MVSRSGCRLSDFEQQKKESLRAHATLKLFLRAALDFMVEAKDVSK
jgi:hypothetical protein